MTTPSKYNNGYSKLHHERNDDYCEVLDRSKKLYDKWLSATSEVMYKRMSVHDKSCYKLYALKNWCNYDKALLDMFFDRNAEPHKGFYSVYLVEKGLLTTFEHWQDNERKSDISPQMNGNKRL